MEAGPSAPRFEESLVSYLEVAARTNDFRDLDRYSELAERSAQVAPAVEYLLAKATFERTDLPDDQRVSRALRQFSRVSASSPYYPQALYLVGVCQVQAGHLEEAKQAFARVAALPVTGDTQRNIRELAYLAVGRIDYELGDYSAALDAYQDIPESSPAFYDALYRDLVDVREERATTKRSERPWSWRRWAPRRESLLPERPSLPARPAAAQARASTTTRRRPTTRVVARYGPVRDQIDQLLAVNGDPAAYASTGSCPRRVGRSTSPRSSRRPRGAGPTRRKRSARRRRWLRTSAPGARASPIPTPSSCVCDRRWRTRLVSRLSPPCGPARRRAGTVDAALLQNDTQLVALEQELLANVLTPGEKSELAELARSRADLERQFANLPKTSQQLRGRDLQRLGIIREKEKELFKLALVLESMRAEAVAVQRLLDQTKGSNT